MKKRDMYIEESLTALLKFKEGIFLVVVNDDFVQPTIDAILKSAATDNVGDGKIFILPVEEAYRIRTGEKGGKSLN
jgi:nitrogen regulatory protein PII